MRELTADDARHAVLGGGVFACGGGGWQHHGVLMGTTATSLNRPVLAGVDELPEDAWIATVAAIGAPAAKNWEIRPVDYVHALKALMDVSEHPISAVMTGQNGYSTTLNGWIQSSVLGVKVLDAAGDVRAHPTGKLGSLGLTTRPGYTTTQVVSGGNRELHGHFLSVNTGLVTTCDDVLRDISVRTGGFIASARNVVELDWVKNHAALGAISLALDLGADMEAAAENHPGAARGEAVVQSVLERIEGRVIARGILRHEVPTDTHGGWDHGTFRIGEHTVPYLNEYMAVESSGQRIATYPDTIAILHADTGLPLAVKDAKEGGFEVVLVVADATSLPLASSAVDPVSLAECEELMGIEFLRYLPTNQASTTAALSS
ncbi:DUF917 family protein [Arthrobacter sp. NPDC058127]|uniref:S-methyl thiohydantoin desulfurase domain-containing protein n=1 Tax=Arthrobacter sp. NPDC058127 TaxID=3346351 RepID=UPI0036E45E98